jgi:hypothetical protein
MTHPQRHSQIYADKLASNICFANGIALCPHSLSVLNVGYGYRQRVVRTLHVTYIPHSIHRFDYGKNRTMFRSSGLLDCLTLEDGTKSVPKRRQITTNPRRVTPQHSEDIYPAVDACSRVTATTPAAEACSRVPSPTRILHKVHNMDPQQRQGVCRSLRCSGY